MISTIEGHTLYNGNTPIAGGIGSGILAITGGGDPMLPLVVAVAAITLGGLLLLRDHWIKRQLDSAS